MTPDQSIEPQTSITDILPTVEPVAPVEPILVPAFEPTFEPTPEPTFEPTPVTAPEELPEQKYSYQPTDEQGRPFGGKQVIKYRTNDELVAKLQEQNVELIRKLRSETKKNRLGITDQEQIPTEAPRFQELRDFSPRKLSADERVRLTRNIMDPEAFDEARDMIFETALGVKPEELRQTLQTLQADNQSLKTQREVDAFLRANPEYVKCQENLETVSNWMLKNKLAPVRENFQRAYDVLSSNGLLVESTASIPDSTPSKPVFGPAPVSELTPKVEPVLEPIPVPVVVPEPKPVVSRVPTGLSRTNGSDQVLARPVGEEITFEVVRGGAKVVLHGLQAINAMPSDVYKRHVLNDRNFQATVNKLEADAARKRAGR